MRNGLKNSVADRIINEALAGDIGPMPSVEVPDPAGFAEEFEDASEDLGELAAWLMQRHWELLAPAREWTIGYLWKRKGGGGKGCKKLGECRLTGGLVAYFSRRTFLIALAADNLQEATPHQVAAVLTHELMHVGAEEQPGDRLAPMLVHHAFEGWPLEMTLYPGVQQPAGRARVMDEFAERVHQLELGLD